MKCLGFWAVSPGIQPPCYLCSISGIFHNAEQRNSFVEMSSAGRKPKQVDGEISVVCFINKSGIGLNSTGLRNRLTMLSPWAISPDIPDPIRCDPQRILWLPLVSLRLWLCWATCAYTQFSRCVRGLFSDVSLLCTQKENLTFYNPEGGKVLI